MKCLFLATVTVYLINTAGSREFRDYDNEAYNVATKPQYDLNDAPRLFEKFVRDFGKRYLDEDDRNRHYGYFIKNLLAINRFNAGKEGETATFDINMFADKGPSEEAEEDNGWGPEP